MDRGISPTGLNHPTVSTAGASAGHDAVTDAITEVTQNLDFNSLTEVGAARQHLAQTAEVINFCAEVLDGVEQAASEAAAATLILYQRAEALGRNIEKIPGKRDEALTTFASHLSPTKKATLGQTIGGGVQENPYSKFFAVCDQQCLVGHVYRARADARTGPDEFHAASDDYAAAATAFVHAGRHDLAGKTIQAAAMLYEKTLGAPVGVHVYAEAAEHFEKAVTACEQNEQYDLAAEYSADAALTYVKAKLLEKAEGSLKRASDYYVKAGRHEEAASALKVIESYHAGRSEEAALALEAIVGLPHLGGRSIS